MRHLTSKSSSSYRYTVIQRFFSSYVKDCKEAMAYHFNRLIKAKKHLYRSAIEVSERFKSN